MRSKFVLAGIVVLLAWPAWAQQQGGPCTRSQQQIRTTSIDPDVMRCQVALDAQRMGELEQQVNALTAALALARSDMEEKDKLADWWRKYATGITPKVPPETATNKP